MCLSIKQVSSQTGLPASTLRYYEAEQLLGPVRRNSINRRVYTSQDLEWISIITCLKNTGMPIQEIRRFVTLCSVGDQTLDERCELLRAHKLATKERIVQLQNELAHIERKVAYYEAACRTAAESKQQASNACEPAGCLSDGTLQSSTLPQAEG